MQQQLTPLGRIGALLAATIALTIIDSYIPHDYSVIRQIMAVIQFGFMAAIAVITLRALIEEF